MYGENYFAIQQQYLILFQLLLITVLIPISFFYVLKMFGKVDSVMVSNLSQRKIPLIIQMLLLFILLRKSITIGQFPELFFFLLGGFISTFLTLIFLFAKIKISIHMIGISALTVFAIGISLLYQTNILFLISFLILMNGMVAASRLQLKAHTMIELVMGFFLGLVPQLVLGYFWL